jgi:dTDP-4-dehydrorhamnose reductase
VTVLVVGSGFIGRAVADAVRLRDERAVLAARRRPDGVADFLALDATDAAATRAVVEQVAPDTVVAVHGPSDVTWCEAHPDEAWAAHVDGARNLTTAAGLDARLVLVSTDNVFPGDRPDNDEDTPTRPANAYGAAKLAAEQVFAHHRQGIVLRASLVYGADPGEPGRRRNFAASCVAAVRAGQPVTVPDPQWTTPVHVADLAAVIAACLRGPVPKLLHVGGPERISRLDWARRIAARLGAADALVAAVPRAQSNYASRPENSCLISRRLPDLLAANRLQLRDVNAGIDALLDGPNRAFSQ